LKFYCAGPAKGANDGEALLGPAAYHQRVSGVLQLLWEIGRIERRGNGGPADPFRYYPAKKRPNPTGGSDQA